MASINLKILSFLFLFFSLRFSFIKGGGISYQFSAPIYIESKISTVSIFLGGINHTTTNYEHKHCIPLQLNYT